MSVLIEDHGPIRLLTLNRPAKLNAFNADLYDALATALKSADQDPAVYGAVMGPAPMPPGTSMVDIHGRCDAGSVEEH